MDEQFNLYRDPAVEEFIRGLPVTREDAWHRLLRYVGHWSLFGYGMFAVFERGSGSLIGEVGLAQFQRGLGADFDADPEAAWLFAGKAHGHGYAIEAMETLMGWFDGTRPEERCVCMIDTENAASVRLAERLDFQAYRSTEYRGASVTQYHRLKR
ncbi:GNAT family N-acetyltransferase [Novosphingobium panipatense]|uniref:GNAT family N-acetyltransferase n=1 Tax=Novosphingobium panipatense TaxID=428991 RepID=UPI0036111899